MAVPSPESSRPIFTAAELQGFDEFGYIVVKQAFSSSVANACVKHVWEAMQEREGVEPNDPSTWLKKVQMDKVWTPNDGYPWCDVFTNRLHQAIREILLVNDLDHSNINNSNHTQGNSSASNKPEHGGNDPGGECCKDQQSIGPFGAGWWTVLFPGFSEGAIRMQSSMAILPLTSPLTHSLTHTLSPTHPLSPTLLPSLPRRKSHGAPMADGTSTATDSSTISSPQTLVWWRS